MNRHVLACAYKGFGCSNGHISVGLILVILVILAVVGGIGAYVDGQRKKAGKPPLRNRPRKPMTDMSPFTASLLSGRNVPAYTAKVSAVTPEGIAVRQARCCARGHQSPAQAVAHAEAIKQRIETTGR